MAETARIAELKQSIEELRADIDDTKLNDMSLGEADVERIVEQTTAIPLAALERRLWRLEQRQWVCSCPGCQAAVVSSDLPLDHVPF